MYKDQLIIKHIFQKIAFTLSVSFFYLFSLFAQSNVTVTGIITDETDTPMAGASIVVKGSTRGVMTGGDGSYSISVRTTDILEFSFIGYQTIMVAVENQRKIDVKLLPKANEMEEVIVTAFGKQKKESVVSSIETVRVADLLIPGTNLTNALAGRVAGLISYQTSGEPGADNAEFFVRGIASFGYAVSPLILIDGFEASNDALARLRPDDIESFSVMKDASASVMYGARGANGIIIVTTKSGREGPAKISARVDVNIATPTRVKEVLDGVSFMRMYNEAFLTRSVDKNIEPFYSEQKIQSTMRGEYPMIYPDVNWYNMLFKSYTVNTKTNLNISGGGKIASYYVSGGFDHETGLLKVDGKNNFNNNITIRRAHIRNNVILNLSPTTKLDTRIQARFDSYNGPRVAANDVFNSVMRINPVDFPAIYEPDAANIWNENTLFGSDFRPNGNMMENPYANMVRGYQEKHESRIRAQASLIQDLSFVTEGLQAQLKGSAETWSMSSGTREYNPLYYKLDNYNLITGVHKLLCLNPWETQTKLGDVRPENDSEAKFFFEIRLHWERKFGKHSTGATAVGMIDNRILTNGRNNSIFQTLPERNAGVSGRLTYSYDSRYFIEGAFGYNGSEKFSEEKTFGFFPSLGAGWIISNEHFWGVSKDVINNLKLKFTLGRVGNDAIAGRDGRFFFLSDINESGGAGYRFGEDFVNYYSSYNIRRYANSDISWELSTKYNGGLELGLFKNESVKIQVDGFFEKRVNIYEQRRNYPKSSGLEVDVYANSGHVNSKGIDGSIDVQHQFRKDVWLQGRGNFTYAVSKIMARDEPNYRDRYRSQIGHSTTQRWGLVAERLFVDTEEINNSPKQYDGNYSFGDIKYKDINNDGVINDEDQVPMGFSTSPEIQYGFGLSAGYKKFDFSFFFQGNALISFFIDAGASTDNTNGIAPFWDRRNALKIVGDNYWSETNPDVHAFWPRLSTNRIDNNSKTSSWWLRNGAFMRLKNVEVGYNIGSVQKIYLSNARVYFSGENLLLFSKFKLWDPEQRSNGLGYPLNRRYNLGLLLSF